MLKIDSLIFNTGKIKYYIYSVNPISIAPVMKNLYHLLIVFSFFIVSAAYSQDEILIQTCKNDMINQQVDSLKNLFSKDGFVLLKEASINMESEYEMPVIVPLTGGGWYQFVFIGEISSRLYEVRMYDWSEKMVVFRQHKWGDVDGNIISFNYIPQFSEFHMIKPVQVNKQKKKNLCGYVMLFRKTKPPAASTSSPSQ